MPGPKRTSVSSGVSRAELQQILGNIDDRKMLEIFDLKPKFEELEQAAKWISGEGEIVGSLAIR